MNPDPDSLEARVFWNVPRLLPKRRFIFGKKAAGFLEPGGFYL